MSTPYVRAWYAIALAFVACVAVAFAAVLYTSHVQKQAERRSELARAESDRRWCSLLTELDDAYAGPPAPATELGRKVATEIHRLRTGFGCPQR